MTDRPAFPVYVGRRTHEIECIACVPVCPPATTKPQEQCEVLTIEAADRMPATPHRGEPSQQCDWSSRTDQRLVEAFVECGRMATLRNLRIAPVAAQPGVGVVES